MIFTDLEEESFITLYTKLRHAEGRKLGDDVVKGLPFIDEESPFYTEWQYRMISSVKVYQYLLQKKKPLKILDGGCGNGWLANMLSEINGSSVLAVDVNEQEVEQAKRVFKNNPYLKFKIFDIEKSDLDERDFDVIVLSATIQYFVSFSSTINKLLNYLKEDGEIQIFDSPIYHARRAALAKKKSREYYIKKGFPSMTAHFHHHTLEELNQFNYQVMYNPNAILNRINRKILLESDSPFPWIIIKKEQV